MDGGRRKCSLKPIISFSESLDVVFNSDLWSGVVYAKIEATFSLSKYAKYRKLKKGIFKLGSPFFWIIILTGSTQFSSGWCATVPATQVFCKKFLGGFWYAFDYVFDYHDIFGIDYYKSRWKIDWWKQHFLCSIIDCDIVDQCKAIVDIPQSFELLLTKFQPLQSLARLLNFPGSRLWRWNGFKILLVNNHWQLWEKGSKHQTWLCILNQRPNDLNHLKI